MTLKDPSIILFFLSYSISRVYKSSSSPTHLWSQWTHRVKNAVGLCRRLIAPFGSQRSILDYSRCSWILIKVHSSTKGKIFGPVNHLLCVQLCAGRTKPQNPRVCLTLIKSVNQTVPIFKISASASLLCHEHGSRGIAFLIDSFYFLAIFIVQNFKITGQNWAFLCIQQGSRTTDTQWRHKSKISE